MLFKICLILFSFSLLSADDTFQETLTYIEEHSLPPLEISPFEGSMDVSPTAFSPSVLVWNKTTFQAAQEAVQDGYRPLVLDMANKSSPGGSVWEGAKTQEETLCRQSNLYLGLVNADYPLLEQGGLLIKNVTFFRNDAYLFLEKPFQADVFASAAYDCNQSHLPDLEKRLAGYDKPVQYLAYESGTKAKMRAMFRAAKENGNDALVLGAFGCGAFKNDPKVIAGWYKDVLSEREFQGAFPMIIFAVYQKNFSVFQSTFPVDPAIISDIAATQLVCFYKTGPTDFLGNFYVCQNGVTVWGHRFQCSEAAFQWKKYDLARIQDPKMKEFFYADGEQAFQLNRYFEKNYPGQFAPKWKEGVRDDVMWEILQAKFQQNPELMDLLNVTSGAYLLEHNQAKRDNYWSDNHDGSGKNMLGKMLMAIRDSLPKPPVDDSSDADLIQYFAEWANQPGSLYYPIY